MARRRAGISGLQQQARTNAEFQRAGEALSNQQLEQLKTQLTLFKTNLEDFAKKYRKDIKRDPKFRMHFQRMCTNIGIDPLASNKGFWSELLGVGDFYYELGVQIAEICIATRERNGGLIDVRDLKRLLERLRGKDAQEISEDDIARSIKTLKPLGSGFDIVQVGVRKLVQSVPRELNTDLSTVLALAQSTGYGGFVTVPSVVAARGWDPDRAQRILDDLLKEGICWIDEQAHPAQYWVAGFFDT
ncbi:EAP30/Vps36 family-domain-containing protein [Fimicolochytrium jonesii]|uniref:EAP30/Vps36 family-domain-containing protein n=1 Tax=Fimicolochytrium jonesii TaxID=1396493 RepID=UPI0022FE5464|nr:EAP30/Vps36 family-domain-containing protein [Fimicolochytrium jonesii]KAI8822144.1 EAP30/Vps36 family-domain-containing protein [Fimicolochytrium jonesii]